MHCLFTVRMSCDFVCVPFCTHACNQQGPEIRGQPSAVWGSVLTALLSANGKGCLKVWRFHVKFSRILLSYALSPAQK